MTATRATSARMPGYPPIAVERLVKIYETTVAVDGISFALAPGSITGLLGGNGAGKTTTIAMIMGLTTPTSGRVTVLGAQMPQQRYRVLQRMNFESPYVGMPRRLTIRQNLTVFGMLYGVPDLGERIARLGEELDLIDLLDRQTGSLSDGQKTRVALAKSLINSPELLLLDEPTASLDPDTADWVRAHIERYRRERNATMLHRFAQHGRSGTAVRARHHHEARPHRGRRYAGTAFGALRPAHARGSISRRGARTRHPDARPRNERACRKRVCLFAAARRRDDAALLVSVALVVAAADRACLLADSANGHLGLPAILHRAERRLLRARRRHLHRRRAALGYFVPRPARLFDFVHGGDVGAQHRQPDDEPAAAVGVRHRADGDEPGAARYRRHPGDGAGDRVLRLQPLRARASRWWRSLST